MNLKKTSLVLILIVGMMALCASGAYAESSDTVVSIRADYWLPVLDGEIISSELALVGTKIDLVDDLGFDDSEGLPAITGSIDLPLPFVPELLFSYSKADSSATNVLTKQLVFNGAVFNVSDTVNSSYDVTHFEALLNFGLVKTDAVDFGILAGVKYFEVETSISSFGVTQTANVKGPVPVVGVKAGIGLPLDFRLEGIGRGISLQIEDVDATLYDIDVGLHYDFNHFLRASAGYRYFMVDAEDDSDGVTDKVDISYSGPYVGVTASF